MADKKISALTGATTPLAGTEVLPIVQSGATVKVAVSDLTAGRAISATEITLTTGNVIVANGQGVDFSATPGTGTSELFADYEEGTWTPAYQSATGSVTTTSSEGLYVKIGKTVYVTCFISGSKNTGVGNLFITGLPFTAISTSNYGTGHFAVVPGMTWGYSGVIPPAMIFAGNSATRLTLWDSSTNNVTVVGFMGAGGGNMVFSMIYEAA